MSSLRRTLPHPVFTAPEDTVAALALLRDFDHAARPEPRFPGGPVDRTFVQERLNRAASQQRPVLLDEGLGILRAAGIRVSDFHVAASREEAIGVARELARPVAMKLVAGGVSHKSDVGGVILGSRTPEEVGQAYQELMQAGQRAGAANARVLVQPLVTGGQEIILGARRDPTFGAVVLVGVGGVLVELFRDVAMRVLPFDGREADAMLRELRAYPLLRGFRGQPPRDTEAIRDGLLAVARIMDGFPAIQEMDVNPLLVMPEGQGAVAVDARIVLAPA